MEFERLLAEAAPLPLDLQIETTTRCNLRCIMCPKGVQGEIMGDLDLGVLDRIGDLIADAWEVRPHGFGEAFLSRGLEKVLRRCAGTGAWIAIVSNGTLVDERRARLLVDVGVQNLIVSIDAADPELFHAIRATSLDKIVENLKGLHAIKAEKGSHEPRVTLQMVGMSNNIQQLPAMMELAASVCAEAVSLVAFTEYDLETIRSLGLKSLLLEPSSARAWIDEAQVVGKRLGVRLEVAAAYESLVPAAEQELDARREEVAGDDLRSDKAATPAPAMRPLQPIPKRVSCTDPWDLVVINYKGEVKPCCMSKRVMGNLHDESFESIWASDEYRGFRERLLSTEPSEECRTCSKAGWYQPFALEDWIEVGRNDHFGTQIGTGWTQARGGVRLSREEAVLRLRNSHKPYLRLTLSLWTDPRLAPVQRGVVSVNEANVGEFELSEHGPHELTFPLAPSDAPELLVRIRCARPDPPSEVLRGAAGRWPGVALSRASLAD